MWTGGGGVVGVSVTSALHFLCGDRPASPGSSHSKATCAPVAGETCLSLSPPENARPAATSCPHDWLGLMPDFGDRSLVPMLRRGGHPVGDLSRQDLEQSRVIFYQLSVLFVLVLGVSVCEC